MIKLPSALLPVIDHLVAKKCRPVVVGGYVRDSLLNIPSKDIDIEVFGLKDLGQLEQLLLPFGKVNSVGKSFGVVKLQQDDTEVDFSLPRQEKKIARGHKGFSVTLDGTLSFKEAARRRDFTINAMGYDLVEKKLLDPFNGQDDLKAKRLDLVDPQTFIEDPLRLYRAVQFAARFELTPSKKLLDLGRQMVETKMLDELPKERIFEEFKKLLLKSRRPSVGFALMDELGMLNCFPELKALKRLPQDSHCHPEGDVWTHTMMVLDAMTTLHGEDEKSNLRLSLAALCHDLGKANTTAFIDGTISAIGHENTGIALTQTLLGRMTDEKALVESILPLVQNHLKPLQFYRRDAEAAAIRRLANAVNIKELIILAKADFLGRNTEEAGNGRFKAGEWLQERAAALNVLEAPLKPLLQGRDLIKAGLAPSTAFKQILEEAYEAQIEGSICTHQEAILWLKELLGNDL
ncbi:HD domain-containing protein [Sulfurimonas sp. HSL3-7]|uniref:CCA tRNA nucleotidyltransferase n=1 Tax=Sulfonitrofixus jiaomeiensis TaxID=3131938 RepID=UPI0031FA130A